MPPDNPHDVSFAKLLALALGLCLAGSALSWLFTASLIWFGVWLFGS